ncbi:MAG: methyl-accepting chemotaxis protein [Natronospirillum sp.]|uniref:methyl-accepting chemotaxis protein n=1 Tax=Natronospirillum sp. TaxID=2812955 RepID=UPI0025EFC8D6|nr:methyl-accepting chemotaxis protein [Natronospirillum sp.]MCH8551877.1 methyl-accepting chemotaxis protein [Natronospirillum sp.]
MKTMSIKAILYIAFSVVSFLMVVIAVVGALGKGTSNNDLETMYSQSVAGLAEMSTFSVLVKDSYIELLEAQTLDPRTRFSEEQIDERRTVMETRNAAIRQHWESISQLNLTLSEREMADDIAESLDTYLTDGVEEATRLILNRDLITASNYVQDPIQGMFEHLNDMTSDLIQARMNFASAQRMHAAERFNRLIIGLSATLIVALLLAISISAYLTRIINRPLNHIKVSLQDISDGKLDQTIQVLRHDELGAVCNGLSDMQANLRDILNQIKTSSGQLSSTAGELTRINNDSTTTIDEQNEKIEQAATAMNELSTAVAEVAALAAETATESARSERLSSTGASHVEESAQAISTVAEKISTASKDADKLVSRVGEVSTVLDVIRDISGQTNLLALNAAIEAARAGESGRGFAVVSDEVRSLAHRTEQSLQEVEKLIAAAQSSSDDVIQAIDSSVKESENAMSIAQQAKAALLEISELAASTSERNESVASATEQQAQVTRDIDQNLTDIRDLSGRASDAAKQSLQAGTGISKLTTTLDRMVARFTT